MGIRVEIIMLGVGGIAAMVVYIGNQLHQIAGDLRLIARQLDRVLSALERQE
jgi:hypothetical protein